MLRARLLPGVLTLLVGGAVSAFTAAFTATFTARPASADPVLVSTATTQPGGLVEHSVSIDFADGLSRSGFIEISFSANFDSSSLATSSWPDIQATTENSTLVELRGGTGGGSAVDVVPIGTLTVPRGEVISYTGVASRNGVNYVLVPEAGAGAAGAVAVAVATLLRARRRARRVA